MKDSIETWYDPAAKVSVVVADATSAAGALAASHLSGPAAAHCLAKGLCAAALVSSGCDPESGESVLVQAACTGPVGGVVAECTADGKLRGYAEKKTIDELDAAWPCDERKALGNTRISVSRTLPGKLLSQGTSNSLDGYLASSLQRKARMFIEASVSENGEVLGVRGVMVEALADSEAEVSQIVAPLDAAAPGKKRAAILARPPRRIMDALGLKNAERRGERPLVFACRCSRERAAAAVAALGEREFPLDGVPVTCHMCGRTYSIGREELEGLK